MKTNGQLCPICGEGHVSPQTIDRRVTEGATSGFVKMQFDLCDACGEESVGLEASRFNKRQIMAFRKHASGLLPGEEVSHIRAKYDVNQKEAAIIFGGGPVAFSKYECDDVAQSIAMDKALRVCGAFPPAFFQFAELAGHSGSVSGTFDKFVDAAAKNIVASGVALNVDLDTVREIVRASTSSKVWSSPVESTPEVFVSQARKTVSLVMASKPAAVPPVTAGNPFEFWSVNESVSSDGFDELEFPPLLKAA